MGQAGLKNSYENCGKKPVGIDKLICETVLRLKLDHPVWGAGRIRVSLEQQYEVSRVPCERTMQRWFREERLTEPRQLRNESSVGASRAVHNIWQVDAKEQLTLADGTLCCYLTITDEYSGAWLDARVFPYYRICEVPVEDIRAELINAFKRWGQPGALRVDNGEPFGTSRRSYTPVLSLWLIGKDVDMIWNKPATPQENGKVERMQGTSSRWAEPEKCLSPASLQKRLDEEALVQREQFHVKRLEDKTRLGVFPQMETSRRPFSEQSFMIQRTYDFLAQKIYVRKTSPSGALMLYGQIFRLGVVNKGKTIRIKLHSTTCEWCFFDDNKEIKRLKAETILEENILKLTAMSSNRKRL